MKRWCFIGVDLGQRRDYTAIAVLEREWVASTLNELMQGGVAGRVSFRVRMMERMRLGTPYPDVVERVKEIAKQPEVVEGRTVVVDGTGVGAPVVDLLRRAGMGCTIVPVLITGGARPGSLRGGYESVGRAELLTGLQVLVQQGRLKVAAGCREGEALRRELLGLKLTGGDSGVHDDLALALALAVWKARVGVA